MRLFIDWNICTLALFQMETSNDMDYFLLVEFTSYTKCFILVFIFDPHKNIETISPASWKRELRQQKLWFKH